MVSSVVSCGRHPSCSVSQVARFIHLNGPPGIGKSTVARVFAAEHPGVLNLDVDQIVTLIGGWQDNFWDALNAGGLLAASMARTHLAAGRDVIMPQLIANMPDFAKFEIAAASAGAEYFHILLTADVEPAIARFAQRALAHDGIHHTVISKIVDDHGGADFLRKIHWQLTEFAAVRQPHSVINCQRQTPEQTYDAVKAALDR
jgi:predicted ABC-type ATPase